MAYFVGFDGGGSKTDCVIGDEQRILGRGVAPSSKITVVGAGLARSSLELALNQACKAAAVEPSNIQGACIGLAGAARTSISESVRVLMQQLVRCPIAVVGDMVIAFEAAFGSGSGVIVIAGTGSICFGRDERGQTVRSGGWGPAVSDEGSGGWIGRRAVGLALHAHDAGQHTALLPGVLTAWKLATRDDVAQVANAYPPPDFAGLVPKVLDAANAGDAVARSILTEAGLELAQLAKPVIRRLWPGPQPVRIRAAGGVFRSSEQVRSVFAETLRAERPEIEINFDEVDSALGALALARKAAQA